MESVLGEIFTWNLELFTLSPSTFNLNSLNDEGFFHENEQKKHGQQVKNVGEQE